MNYYQDTNYLLLQAGDKNFIKLSKWTTGDKCFTTRLPTPPLCTIYFSSSETLPKNIRDYFNENKRIKGVVAFIGTDLQKEQILDHFKSLR